MRTEPDQHALSNLPGQPGQTDQNRLDGTNVANLPERVQSTNDINLKETFCSRLRSTRFTLLYLGFVGNFLFNAHRVNMSVSLVDMVESTAVNVSQNENCPISSSLNTSNHHHQHGFDWSSGQQATVLGAFYYGYTVTQIPAGILASIYGGKLIFGLGILLAGLCTLLTAVASNMGVQWLVALRILEGMVEAGTSPSFNHLMGQWAPQYERSFFSAFAFSGSTLGNVVTSPIMGYLCTLSLLDGWPLGFYATGGLSIMWYGAWCLLASESPDTHPRISAQERAYIKENTSNDRRPDNIPWKGIFSSRAFYGLLMCHVGCNFTSYGLMSCLPQYLSNVLNFDISSNGFLSALPWMCAWISTLIFCNVTDWLRSRKVVSTTVIRKINCFIGTFFPGLFLILAGYAGCNDTLAVSFIVIAMFFFGANWSGYNCNNLDIAASYAGVLYSITNTFATIPGFVAPLIVDWITRDNVHSEELWRSAFFVFAGVGWFGGVCFIILGSGEVQPWAVLECADVDGTVFVHASSDDHPEVKQGEKSSEA